MVFVSRVSLAGALALAACTKPNPAFDPGRDDAGASASSTSSTSGPPPDTSSDTSSTSGSTSSSDSSTGTLTGALPTTTGDSSSTGPTTGPACGLPGDACGVGDCCEGCGVCTAGACVQDDAACGPCGSCGGDGQCMQLPPRSPCSLPADPCLGKVWGLDDGTCRANGAASATCDDGGQCIAGECPKGAEIVVCDASCVVDPGQCAAGIPEIDVDPSKLCAQNGPTDACKPGCLISEPQDIAKTNTCVAGKCVAGQDLLCGLYACEGGACNMACEGVQDCKASECVNNVCT